MSSTKKLCAELLTLAVNCVVLVSAFLIGSVGGLIGATIGYFVSKATGQNIFACMIGGTIVVGGSTYLLKK